MIDLNNQRQVEDALAEPFARTEVKFKPAAVSGNRAMALCYLDARAVQDRLDDVMGPLNWQDDYECLADGNVVCRLRLRIAGEWVTKVDVGGQSEQPDEGDRMKAAFSDALKRAAVKFGIGRYLYRLPSQWVDYDPQRKQFARPPSLPDFALPKQAAQQPRQDAPAAAAKPEPAREQAQPVAPVQEPAKAAPLADGVPRITPAQAQELESLIAATRSDREKLLGHYHVTGGQLSGLPAEHFNDAAGRLRQKQAQQVRAVEQVSADAERLKLDWEADLLPQLRRAYRADSVRCLTPPQVAEFVAWMESRGRELAAQD